MSKYTKQLLESIVSTSISVTQVLDQLNLAHSGGNHAHIKRRIQEFGIDTSHFVGQGSNKGRVFGVRHPIEYYLVKNCPTLITSHTLKLRLIKDGCKTASCEMCFKTEWLGHPLPLELHHINGDHYDNRFENLQILCPNCHALMT